MTTVLAILGCLSPAIAFLAYLLGQHRCKCDRDDAAWATAYRIGLRDGRAERGAE